jgi:dihydroorotate dehydrogenase (NAD+) catalytic subunit
MAVDLSISLGRLRLRNPVLVASGTFGYAREMADFVDFSQLGGVIPKTVTAAPRAGNSPPRTIESPSGLINAIGLDNDGIDYFIAQHMPYLRSLPTATIGNIAGKTIDEFAEMAAKIGREPGLSAVELNLSCPNVSGGIDFATDPEVTRRIVSMCRDACPYPLIAKLTPAVADIVSIARAAADGGADAITLINTMPAMAIDWRRNRPVLGNATGGLSGPAIKPIALRFVWQVAKAKVLPIVAAGGISNIDDTMEFLVAGASAVQVGTANFVDPMASMKIVAALPEAVAKCGATSMAEVVGRIHKA